MVSCKIDWIVWQRLGRDPDGEPNFFFLYLLSNDSHLEESPLLLSEVARLS
jgi:hypothetical protein